MYTHNLKNCLIPLEIIYRNGLPAGILSLQAPRAAKNFANRLGLDHEPKPGERLAKPIFDVSTKLEETDRYLTWEEAEKIAGLTSQEVSSVKSVLSKVNETISEIASHAGMENEDGKIELAFDKTKANGGRRRRHTGRVPVHYKGLHVSKEIARQFYKQTDWYRRC